MIALIGLVFVAPLMLVIAAAIKLDSPGPVFFKQRRYGFNDRLIEVWKFLSTHSEATDADAVTQATRWDPRVTRVGRFLRKSSFDELPQLFNVLRGEMSIIGPGRTPLQPKPKASCFRTSWMYTRPDIVLSPESQAGRRSRDGEARRKPSTRSASALSMTSTTSTIGRCGSISSRIRKPDPASLD
jgi:hypothetical protein